MAEIVSSTDFNRGFILPTLLTQLKSILDQYPDDGQILKELVQNAEDAGAKRVVFLLDHTSYPDDVTKLHHADMKLYQGPALYCYNDAVFTERDWKGIRMLSDSVKQKDPMKVGRFGLGFKSVFHMTDLPSIFSGEGIGFLDPHEQFFQNGRLRTSSFLWNVKSEAEYIRNKIDQFAPFFHNVYKQKPGSNEAVKFSFPCACDGTNKASIDDILNAGYFNGTLFRFPLRTEEMTSELNNNLYTPKKVLNLFDTLKVDAHIMLLFLKSIETIEVHEKLGSDAAPRKIMEIRVGQGSRDFVAAARGDMITKIGERRDGKRSQPVSVPFEMSTQLVCWDHSGLHQNGNTPETETKNWVICHYYAGKEDLADGGESGDELGFLPWVAIAQPLPALDSDQTPPPYMDQPKGQIFCFLPLPLENESPTGFQFHVHGYFAMDQNRRHIKKRTAEQIGIDITDQSLLWNEYLIRRLMPFAVRDIATHVANSTSLAATYGRDVIYSTIPNMKLVKEQWKPVGEQLIKTLPDMRVFYSKAGGGRLVQASEARFDYIDDKSPLQEVIRRVLLASSVNLVSVPSFVLKQLHRTARKVSAREVCEGLKSTEGKIDLSNDDRMLILRYLVDSLDRADFRHIVNTKLLPLSDDTWTEFKSPSPQEKVYIDSAESPRSLLPGLDRIFIRPAAVDIGKRLVNSDVTQLVVLDQKEVAILVRQLLQPYNGRGEIIVTELKWFSDQWLKELWQYLTKHRDCMELSSFDELQILPKNNKTLMKLSQTSAVVVEQCQGRQQLDRTIAEICKQLGVTVIENIPEFAANHPVIWGDYVQRPDGTGVVTALNRLEIDKDECVVASFDTLSEGQKDNFRDFIIRADLVDKQLFNVGEALLRELPMFRVVPNSTDSERSHVSLCDVETAAPDSLLPVRIRQQLLDASDSLVSKFLSKFGIERLSLAEALVDHVFPDVKNRLYDADQIAVLMTFVFEKWPELERTPQTAQIADQLSAMEFVPTRSGRLRAPRELYDQNDTWIRQLFEDEDIYPHGELAESKYRHILKQLGLKGTADIGADDILDIVRKLEVTYSLERTNAVLRFLESKIELLLLHVNNGDLLLDKLVSLRWVALEEEEKRPSWYPKSLQFSTSQPDYKLRCPRDITSSEFSSLIDSVRPVVDVSAISQVAATFGWNTEPPIQQVVTHLLNLISAYDRQHQAEFHSMLKDIYSYLDRHISEFEAVADQLAPVKWVCYFNGFAKPSEMVLQKSFRNLEPYVFVMPADFVTFERLWQRVGIDEKCDLVEVINRITKCHCDPEREHTSEEIRRDLDMSVCILNEIASSPERGSTRDELQVPVKTSDDSLVLKPIADCTYCDKEWFQQGFDVQHIADNADINLVHPLISIDTAEALNIHSICSRVLDAQELEIGVGYESYGQSEPLTRRLKNILRDYNDGLAVVKELVQNADDAGATEVKFLYDQRTNEDFCTTLIDPGMKQVQGPALWAYNDATFSNADFDNLVKLSGATKELCKNKVGRFGLGFNAVYNLTDVPSLVSNGHVVFLDPHTTHLKRAIRDKSKPGIKIDIAGKRKQPDFFQFYTDQFKPYNNIFGCDFQKATDSNSRMTSYPGTLFRFPLRSEQQSRTSEISNKHYDHNEVCSLFHLLAKISDQILLFTQSVKEVSFYHLGSDESNPQNMELQFTITKHMQQILRALPGTQPFAFLKEADKLMASYCIGSEIPQMESSAVIRIDYKKGQSSKADLLNDVTDSSSHWLVTSCIGKDKSFMKAIGQSDLISVGGAAAPLHSDSNGRYTPSDKLGSVQTGGTVFCFMPLPIKSSLPVHINGYFAVTSSRMHLVEETVDDKTTRDATWNKMLMEDAVKQAYVILLQDLVKICPSAEPYSTWPGNRYGGSVANTNDLFGRMINAVYDELCRSNGPEVFKADRCIVNIDQCKFLDVNFRGSRTGSIALSVFKQVKSDEVEVIDLPTDVMNTMLTSSARAEFSKYLVDKFTFFRDWFLPCISKADAHERDQLVIEALFNDSIKQLLSGYNCIPVKPNGVLKSPSSLIHPLSDLAILYDEAEERFPAFTSKVRTPPDLYRQLVSLGMKESDLSWAEIASRCKKVSDHLDIAPKRLKILVRLMSRKNAAGLKDTDHLQIDEIRKTKFLPAAKKPDDFCLPWKGDNCGVFLSCEEAYLSSELYAVCCSFPLIDDHEAFGYGHSDLKKLLHINPKHIDVETILYQLDRVLDRTDTTGKIIIETGREFEHIEKTVDKVYSFLDSFVKNSHNERYTTVCDELGRKKCIFDASAKLFMSPHCCAVTIPAVDKQALLPYLCAVPESIKMQYPLLLRALEIRSTFAVDDYVTVLQDMHSCHKENPLCEHDLKVAACVINSCLTLPEGSVIPQVYIPNANGVLHPATSLCYSIDDEFLSVDGKEFCHSSILPKAARSLGVKTIKHAYIDQRAIGIPFGQKEELVVRLKRILAGYPFDKEILKEMLQNADDAGATKIHFILDKRQLPTKHVFADSWKPLQGPALCVYNNKPFTSKDIEGIQKLGEGSKGHDPTKTGQYGVGFNCVYHVTDVPILRTHVDGEETLCIFDPNCRFFPGATRDSPGRRLPVMPKDKAAFRDVFAGFLMNEYGDNTSTFFRLPLRNTDSAAQSEISNKNVSVAFIQDLFKMFISDMHDSMLFLNSVEEIHLRVIETNSDVSEEVYSTRSKLTEEDRQVREKFKAEVSNVAKALKNGLICMHDIDTVEAAYKVGITDSRKRCTEWIVVQKFGFDTSDVVPKSVKTAYAAGDIGLLPRGGLAYCTSSNEEIGRNSRLFCFLPLPIHVDLPVHVNGHFSLSGESRRELWHSDGDYRTDWNTCLMNNVIASAYCILLHRAKKSLAKQRLKEYYAIFPTVFQAQKTNPYLNNMSISVYKHIARDELPLLAVYSSDGVIRWLPPLKTGNLEGNFDDLSEQIKEPQPLHLLPTYSPIKQEVKKPLKHEIVREVLTAAGYILFLSPISLYSNFMHAGVPVKKVAAENVLHFFSSFQSSESVCKLKVIDVPIAKTVFKDVSALTELLSYCTTCCDYKWQLVGLPFLVTCDNYVRQFTANDIRYDPQFAAVLPHKPQKFIHKDVFLSLKLNSDKDAHLSKHLSVSDFVHNLADLLPAHIFRDFSECVPLTTLVEYLRAAHVPISWLAEVWRFLSFLVKPTGEPNLSVIKPVQEWCLLPAVFGGKEVLFAVASSRCVIPLNNSSFTRQVLQIQNCLGKLGIPQPFLQYFDASGVPKLYTALMGSLDDASSVVNALSHVIKSSGPLTGRLLDYESLALLTYLTEKLSSWKDVPDGIEMIQKLPIFRTVAGKLVSIHGCRCYIIPHRVPVVEMDHWKSIGTEVFLKHDDSISPLLKYIGCVQLTETELYCSFILQHIDLLTDVGRDVHLKFVRDKLLPLLQQDSQNVKDRDKQRNAATALASLTECLNELEIIPSLDGSLHRASDLYDPSNEVFIVMEDESLFPHASYNDYAWLNFLRQCGLVHVVTQEQFCCYALKLEDEGKVKVTDKVERKSKVLVKHFFARDDVTDTDFLKRVREIPFIVPLSVGSLKEKMHEQFGVRNAEGKVQLIKFANSIITDCADCVWTVQTVIPSWACPDQHCSRYSNTSLFKNLEFVFSTLGVDKQPKLETVAKHVQALCSKLSTVKLSQCDSITLHDVLGKVYTYLQSKMPLPKVISAMLSLSPFVYDKEHSLLVRPDQVVVRYRELLRPYLIPLPFNVGNYKALLCALGAIDGYEPTINQLAHVLRMLHAESKDQVLNPTERKIVHSVMREFFTRIMNSDGPIQLTEELYLPDRDMKLHKSTDTVFDDKYILLRLENFDRPVLMDLTQCGLQYTRYDIKRNLTRLPAAVQPQLMSAVVTEKLCPDFQDVKDLQLAVVLNKRIRSHQFQQGLVRLALHSASEGSTTVSRRDSEAKVMKAVEGIQNVSIRGVDKLETILMYKGVAIEGSNRKIDFLKDVNNDGSVKRTVYVTSWCNKHRIFLLSELAVVVDAACNHLFGHSEQSHICKILDCEPEDIDEILDRCNVMRLTDNQTGESFLPVLGSFVPNRDYCCLRQDMQLLQPGDLAAMDVGNPAEQERTYILVKIVEKLVSDTNGEVADSFTTEVGAVYRVIVKTDVKQDVHSTLLFAFARETIDPSTDDYDDHLIPSNYDDATRGLKAALQDAWKLSEDDRKRVLIRLMQPWLPGNSRVDRELAEKVMEFIFMASDRLENNLPIDESDVVAINAPTYRPVWTQHNTSHGASNSVAGSCFKYLTARAEEHRRERELYEQRVSGNRTAGKRDRKKRSLQQFYASFVTECNPQPGEGKRWLRQADIDLQAAENDNGDSGCKAFEWSCFKYYQIELCMKLPRPRLLRKFLLEICVDRQTSSPNNAVKSSAQLKLNINKIDNIHSKAAWKALRGAQYARDANRDFDASMRLSDLTSQLDDGKLQGYVTSLVRVVDSPNQMMYPGSRAVSSTIPNDVYLRETAGAAKSLCSDVLEWCRDYIKRSEHY